jgi:predicted ATPase/signal transduction histidine kinase
MLETEPHEHFETVDVLYQTPSTSVERARSDHYGSVIIKRCLAGISEAQRNRFLFSAELLQKFNHPNIVPVLEVAEASGLPYLVLEDNDSVDLRAYAESFPDHQLPLETFLLVAIQLADALGVIHHAQVIHKDLHPGNVVIQPDSLKVRIIDFGLASLLSREQPVLAPPENLEGVLAYLSPEQTGRMNRALDYRTDFYTLGVTFYQLLTGQLPFTADDALGLVYAHMAVQQTPVNELRTEIPCVISNIVNKLLSKNAEDRYQSALGLKHDLERCLEALNQSAQVHELKLGTKDISDRFRIPQILYGREQEVNRLLSQFQTASQGKPQLLAVAGYSGIGKSALVHEVHKPIAACNGLFINGKFDQFQQNTPYSALKTALKTWLNQVLRLPEVQLQLLRKQLLKDIGQNARVMIDFMAEFEPLLGALEPIPELGAQETQARFHLVFQSFIRSVTKHQSWVIFIDDLQWADRGTLNLLPELLSEPESRLLIVVAYRDNEVDDQHPAVKMLNSIERETVVLGALPQEQVAQLLVDTLYRTETEISELAQLVHKKTDGNPFFTIEFLKTLYSKQLLDFDLAEQHWCWDISAIEAEAITDNVVELMLQKMETLPPATQELLQLAACVGTRFDLHTLAVISSQQDQAKPMIEVARTLWPALRDGLLLQAGGDWFLGMTGQVSHRITQSLLDNNGLESAEFNEWIPECKFSHDRMLQAAYESLEDTLKAKTHLNIGRLMLHFATEQEREHLVFEIIEQLNHGVHLITDARERLQLAELNLSAARKAKQASVWDAALRFTEVGLSLLPENSWQAHYELTKELNWLASGCSYLTGEQERSNALFEVLLQHISDPVDKAELYAERIVYFIGSGLYEQGFKAGIEGLALLNISFPADEVEQANFLSAQNERLNALLVQTPLDRFVNLPELNDRSTKIAMFILVNLWAVVMILKRPQLTEMCIQEAIILSGQKGRCEYTGIALAVWGSSLTRSENFVHAWEAGQQALALSDKYPTAQANCSILNYVAANTHYIRRSFQECIELHRQGFEVGIASGELARASINLSNIGMIQLANGAPLYELQRSFDDYMAFCQPKKLYTFQLPIGQNYVRSMVAGEYTLADDNFDVHQLAVIKQSLFNNYLEQLRLQFFFWSDEALEKQLKQIELVEYDFESLNMFAFSMDVHGITCLLYLQAKRKAHSLNTPEWKARFKHAFEVLTQLSELNPTSYLHKVLLIQAEHAQLENKPMEEVCLLYKQSIEDAEKNGFQHYEALGNELYGRYLIGKGLPELAQAIIEKAYEGFKRWGSMSKLNNLAIEFPSLSGVCERNASSGASRSQLDYSSLIKGSQAISSQLSLSGLVAEVMTILMENAGAQLGALVFKDQDQLFIEARVETQTEHTEYLQHTLLTNEASLPISLIDLCLRTEQLVKLDDASTSLNGYKDAYLLQKKPKSVLCMPMWYRDRVIGVLYLENNLATDAFTEQCLDTLGMLLAQAAISLENARLFEQVNELNTNLENKVEARTKELKATQAQLVEAEKMAALGELVRGVAHELNTPLGTAVTAASIVSELSEELERKFKDNSLTSSFLKDYFANIRNSGELLNSAITRTSRMVDTFKTISVDEVVDTLCDFSLNDTLVLISSQLRHSLAENGQEFLFSCVDQIQMHSYRQVLMDVIIKLVESAKQHAFENNESGLVSVTVVSASEDGQVIIDVRDNGKGMSSELLEKVFDPFTTSNRGAQENIGLGMHVVYNLVTRKLGGAIECYSKEGEGTGFIMTLPKTLKALDV